MDGVRSWLLAVLSACILCAVAESLMPSGTVKRVGKLVCGLVLLCALLSGGEGLDLSESRTWMQQWRAGLETEQQELENQVQEEMKVIIEEEFEAYIVDKAAQLGLDCTVQVTCGKEGELWVPEQVRIAGGLGAEEQAQLERILWEELEIPRERQKYEGGEESP